MSKRRDIDWFYQIGSELQSLSEELLRGAITSPVAARQFWEPRVDVYETATEVIVIAEIAGVNAEEISLTFSPDRGSLIIRGQRNEVEEDGRIRCYQLEIYYGDFLREVPLPEVPLNVEGIRATCRNGFLRISVPKRTEEPDRRTIPVVEG